MCTTSSFARHTWTLKSRTTAPARTYERPLPTPLPHPLPIFIYFIYYPPNDRSIYYLSLSTIYPLSIVHYLSTIFIYYLSMNYPFNLLSIVIYLIYYLPFHPSIYILSTNYLFLSTLSTVPIYPPIHLSTVYLSVIW